MKKKLTGEEQEPGEEKTDDLNLEEPVKENELEECDAPFGEKKEPQNIKSSSAPFNEKPTKLKTESKIRKTLAKYFEPSLAEQKQDGDNLITEAVKKSNLLKEGKEKCKTVEQEISLTKVLNYDNGFDIKTMNSNVIVETNQSINVGGKKYQKLLMVETTGKVTGILKDTVTKTARQYRMNNKIDYLNFKKLGK